MKRLLVQLALVLMAVTSCASAADSLDRIVATVNRQPILSSDLDDASHFEAIQQAKTPTALDADRRAVLNRVIDRELIRQQMQDTYTPTKELVDRQISELRAQFPSVKSESQWNDLLASYQLDEAVLRDDVTLRLKVVNFLEVRLRPTVRVDQEEVSEYYEKTLVPQLKAANASIEPLDKVKSQIEEVLLQKKMTEVFDAWVANLRSQGNISILDSSLSSPAAVVPEKNGKR